jgi:hypothetical protein
VQRKITEYTLWREEQNEQKLNDIEEKDVNIREILKIGALKI